MELDLGTAQQFLAAQPFSVLLGAELTACSPEATVLVVPLEEKHLQQNGVVHGGVLAYAADNALTFAAGAAVGPEVMTAEVKINYLAGARGRQLEARAWVVKAGKRQVTVRCDIYDVDGDTSRLCAAAQGTIARVEGKLQ